MTDFLDPAARSERMSRIRSRDTKPELNLRNALHHQGLRYRLGGAGLPGRPDLVFPRHKAVVFVHGCFWHRHRECKVASVPKSNIEFWIAKFDRNVERDQKVNQQLRALGWKVIVAWECELVSNHRITESAEAVASEIRKKC